jgi:rfaE bifunctional protein nucleotidyltransferase chain/domain
LQKTYHCDRKNYSELREAILELGSKRVPGGYRRIVFTNGCFDILHPGHLATLQFAAQQAGPHGAVVVAINSDSSISRLKGPARPVMPEVARAALLASLRCVDHVVTFEEDTPLELIRAIKPDVIVKGGDYDSKEIVGKDEAVVLTAPYDDTWSTTKIINKIIMEER